MDKFNFNTIKMWAWQMADKLEHVSKSVYGWLAVSLSYLYSFFAPEQYAFTLVLAMIFFDAVFGMAVARKRGDFLLSKLGRLTLFKISAYFATLAFVYMVEKLAHDTGFIGVRIAAAWAAACEFWSMSASILILWPNAPFFKIMRMQLKGEISNKLGQNIDDVLK